MDSKLHEAARVYREAKEKHDAAQKAVNDMVWSPTPTPEPQRHDLRAAAIRAEAEYRVAQDALLLRALQGE